MLNVVVTIDVENPQTDYRNGRVTSNLIDPFIYNELYGVSKLTEIFALFDIKGVFFVATSEKYIFGEEYYKTLCIDLHSKGHELAVHSHPEWISRDGRIHMWQYSYSEQLSMLSEMKQDIQKWSGSHPISHRAGAYGADENTLRALKSLNLAVDSSNFAEHKNCKIQLCYNQVVRTNGLIEFPVTGFHKIKRLNLRWLKIAFSKDFVKTDIETCTLEELKWYVEYAIHKNLKIVNLFMHSYSLFNLQALPKITPNNNENKLISLLEYLKKNPNIQVTTLKNLHANLDINMLPEPSLIENEEIPIRYQDFSISQVFVKILKKLYFQSRHLWKG